MAKNERHCRAISAVPTVATTGLELKLTALGAFVVQIDRMMRSAPWGIVFPKDFTGGGGS